MAGVTDVPFRELAWRFGAGYLVSEMVSAKADLWNTDKSRLRRQRVEGARPFVVQIAGGDPETVAEGACRHWRAGAASQSQCQLGVQNRLCSLRPKFDILTVGQFRPQVFDGGYAFGPSDAAELCGNA